MEKPFPFLAFSPFCFHFNQFLPFKNGKKMVEMEKAFPFHPFQPFQLLGAFPPRPDFPFQPKMGKNG